MTRLTAVLCVLLLSPATAQAQAPQFDLLEPPPVAQPATSPFDLLHQAEPDGVSAAQPIEFDLLFVLKTLPKVITVEHTGCQCGCGKADCSCSMIAAGCRSGSQISNLKSQIPKPVVYMRSASWCAACAVAKKQIADARDCPFELRVISQENSEEPLPRFTWEAGGKWFVPVDAKSGEERSGFYGVNDLVAHWRHTQKVDGTLRDPKESGHGVTGLQSAIADSVTRHFVARVQSPPAGLSQPHDSPKKSSGNSTAGNSANAAASGVKSPPPSGPNTATPSASTHSPGGRS